MDKNYWKEHYAGSWKKASEKEEFIKKQIADATGLKVINYGLGSGFATFINGSAVENNMKKGDADLYIEERNCFIEITGPNIPVLSDADLWFRPDKIQNAYDKYIADNSVQSYFVHLQNDRGTNYQQIRVLVADAIFFLKWKNAEYKVIKPPINGRTETYHSITPKDDSLISFKEFINLLKKHSS